MFPKIVKVTNSWSKDWIWDWKHLKGNFKVVYYS